MKAYMAIDQYGTTHHIGRTSHPRKALLDMLGYKSAQKMYADNSEGETLHVGYIIGGLWLNLFEVTPCRRKA